ncbi:efflux RND transporter periplasmic adaptor subunit [uncultured Roseibium sp.]|uniref:efflux RND transporter periplasmic adaptor subunit n=1 Tax=uncultured Roseibium sp. TaxID=1936171 RepID=UPI003216DBB2
MIRKTVFPLLLVAALAACQEKQAEVQKDEVRPVKVVQVAPATSVRKLEYSGIVRARSETAAGFRIAGKIVERKVDVGDHVKAGDLLARIDPTDYELSVKSAEAALSAAERQVETAAFALKRMQQLFDKKWVAKASLEQAQLSYNQAEANRDTSKAQLDQARNQVGYSELRADRPGIISAVQAEAGQVVSAGSPVVTIAADGEKEVAIAVPETDVLSFKPGKRVEVGLWSNKDLKFNGRVREVSGSADPASRTFAVRISLPADDRVLLGMTAFVNTSEKAGEDFYSVPLAALSRGDQDKSIVWTVNPVDETVHARPVTVSEFSGDGVRVSNGLKTGDLVISAGTQFMTENLKVKLPDGVTKHTALAAGRIAPSSLTR